MVTVGGHSLNNTKASKVSIGPKASATLGPKLKSYDKMSISPDRDGKTSQRVQVEKETLKKLTKLASYKKRKSERNCIVIKPQDMG